MHRIGQSAWCLVGVVLLLLCLHGAQAHQPLLWKPRPKVRQKYSDAGSSSSTSSSTMVVGVRAPPSGDPLMPECVPKFVTELVLPLPMPTGSKQDPGCFNFADIVPRDCKQYEEQEQTQEQQQEQQQEEDHKDQGPMFTPPEGYEGIGLIDYSNIINHRWQHDQDSKYPSTGSQEPGGNEKEDGGYVEEDEGADRTWEMPEQQHEQQRLKGGYASREPKQQQQRKDGYTRKEPEQQQQQQQQRHKDGHARREPEQQEQQQQRKDGGGSKGGDGYHKQQRDTKQYPKGQASSREQDYEPHPRSNAPDGYGGQDNHPRPEQQQTYETSPGYKAPNSYGSEDIPSDNDDDDAFNTNKDAPALPVPDYSHSENTLHKQFRRIPRKGAGQQQQQQQQQQEQQQPQKRGEYAGPGSRSGSGGGGGLRQRQDKQHRDRLLGDVGDVKDKPVLPVKPTPPILLDEFPKVAKPQPEQQPGSTNQPAPKQTFAYDEPAPQQQQQQQDGYYPPPKQNQGTYPPQPKHQFVYDAPLPEQTDYDDDYAPLPQQPNYMYDTYEPAELASLPQQQNGDDDAYQPGSAVLASLPELEDGNHPYQPAELAVSRWGNPRAQVSKSAAVRTLIPAKDNKSEGQGAEKKQKSDQQVAGSGEKPAVPEDENEPARLERVLPQKAPKKAESLQKSQKTVTPLQQSPKKVEPGYERPYGCEPPSEFKEYRISVKRVKQEVLPVGQTPLRPSSPGVTCPLEFKKTSVFAYGPKGMKGRHNWPAFTIESQRYTPNRIVWVNGLKDDDGNHLPHLLDYAVDQTLHWANPEALDGVIDSSPCKDCGSTYAGDCANVKDCKRAASGVYSGPVPIVTHVHGMEHVRDHSDGYPEAWYMPDGEEESPTRFEKVGSWYKPFQHEYSKETCQPEESYEPGTATYLYTNMQRPSTAWYHDDTLGLARLNVYAGMTGFYLVRKFFPTYSPEDAGPELPGLPYPPPGGAEDPADIRELPLVIQDRVFERDSKLWYPVAETPKSMAFPAGVQPPLWIPGFSFGPDASSPVMMTVNGKTWPKKTLAPDTYRLRLLNGCNARVLQLQFARTTAAVKDLGNANKNTPLYSPLPFHVLGNGAGFFPRLQGPFTSLVLGPAERYDIIIDLSALTINDHVYMINTGPESSYDGTNNGETSMHTSQLMRFEFTNPSASRLATTFNFNYDRQASLNEALLQEALGEGPGPHDLPASERPVRQMALIEAPNPNDDTVVKAVLLGTANCDVDTGSESTAAPRYAHEGPSTVVPSGEVEEWDIINLTEDAHPIHVHGVFHQIVERINVTVVDDTDPLKPVFVDNGSPANNDDLDRLIWIDCPHAVSVTKKCMANRDTTLLLPATRTRVRMRTGKMPGVFVWGSTQLEHKDNAMMLPFCLGQPRYRDPKNPEAAFCERHLQATQSKSAVVGSGSSSSSTARNQSGVVT